MSEEALREDEHDHEDQPASERPRRRLDPSRAANARQVYLGDRFVEWLNAPQPILRLEIVRIFAPLAILGFMAGRLAYADELLGHAGFHVPELATSDYRQPFYVPPVADGLAWVIAIVFVTSGLALSAGFRARIAASVFALCATWVTLADRLSSFSVSKMAPMIGLALALAPCGQRWSIDAWLAKKRDPDHELPTEISAGTVRFFQVLVPTIYCASGIAKARGDWLSHPYVLWTHLHDTYQTSVTVALANLLPPIAWSAFQLGTLVLEAGAPIWFSWKKTRPFALAGAVAMHTMIGLMFGPVRWFAMLMITLWVASYTSPERLERWLARVTGR